MWEVQGHASRHSAGEVPESSTPGSTGSRKWSVKLARLELLRPQSLPLKWHTTSKKATPALPSAIPYRPMGAIFIQSLQWVVSSCSLGSWSEGKAEKEKQDKTSFLICLHISKARPAPTYTPHITKLLLPCLFPSRMSSWTIHWSSPFLCISVTMKRKITNAIPMPALMLIINWE